MVIYLGFEVSSIAPKAIAALCKLAKAKQKVSKKVVTLRESLWGVKFVVILRGVQETGFLTSIKNQTMCRNKPTRVAVTVKGQDLSVSPLAQNDVLQKRWNRNKKRPREKSRPLLFCLIVASI